MRTNLDLDPRADGAHQRVGNSLARGAQDTVLGIRDPMLFLVNYCLHLPPASASHRPLLCSSKAAEQARIRQPLGPATSGWRRHPANQDKSMEIVVGALPSLVHKLGELLVGEYNLQKEVKGGIIFLQAELESMQGALEKISRTPADKIDDQDKIWARKVREMSYDIEDSIDKYIVQCKGRKTVEQHSFKEAIDRTLKWFRQPKIRRKIATEIREIKSRVIEVHERRERYKIDDVDKPAAVDPRLLAQYKKATELVGIDEARDEVINILVEGDGVSSQHGKVVSIVGFGGLGKTTLAKVVYEKIKGKFDCWAFVPVSQNPDMREFFKRLLYELGKNVNDQTLDERQLIDQTRKLLQTKRYCIVIDDIWSVSIWDTIRCALPDDVGGYIIITTTRVLKVAERVGGAYTMKPLCLESSRKLLYRRIFGNGNKDSNEDIVKYPDDELAEVSERILKKCAGVPLAIITMASLLACKARDKMEWYEVCNSVGTGLENNLDVENMRKILSFSYYELPCHLRACLLYLSMFPEDYEIGKDRLIKMWIGEGFIQCEKAGKSLFEVGESYFNELINRSMIQPIHDEFDMISRCRVHDMVLDLIRSLSSEENFVTVLSNMGGTSPSNTIRRLSLQNGQENLVMAQATWSLQHARSIVVFPAATSLVPPLACCRVLRVLDLKGCNLSQANSSLKYLGNLHHLRYLGLFDTGISQLPEEIGNLQLLQILDVRGNEISRLPSSVVQLRKLMCLYIDEYTRVPNGIGNLTCLEQLLRLRIDDSAINIIEELGQLTELRVLIILLDEWNDKLLECLCKLQKMQNLVIVVDFKVYNGQPNIGGLDAWVVPRHLRELSIQGCWFLKLPAWVNPALLLVLTKLSIDVRELHQADLEILGRLPALRFLYLEVDNKNLSILAGFVVGAGAFPCLVNCFFYQFVWPVVFQQGAMPMLRDLTFFGFYLREARGIACNDGSLNLGLGNLPSLQFVKAGLQCDGAGKEEAEQAKAALTHEAKMHPNHPIHLIYITV